MSDYIIQVIAMVPEMDRAVHKTKLCAKLRLVTNIGIALQLLADGCCEHGTTSSITNIENQKCKVIIFMPGHVGLELIIFR